MPVTDTGAPEADLAGEAAAEDLPKRSPLMQRGLTKQQWADLQHQKATKPSRKALSFQYPAGSLHVASAKDLRSHLLSGCSYMTTSETIVCSFRL